MLDDRPTIAAPDDDPYLWLEEIEGPRALSPPRDAMTALIPAMRAR
jgi:hypothetical protein